MEVLGVADGQEALTAVERVRPDLIVLDVELPNTDGFALAAKLSRLPDTSH